MERFRYAFQCGNEHLRKEIAADPHRRTSLEREMAGEEVKRDRMVAAIQGGDPPDTLVQAIRKSEGRLAEFHAELKRLESMPNLEMLGLPAMEAAIGKELSRFADLLTGNVPLARQGLKKLLVDSIDFLPRESATGKQTSVFKTTLSYGAIVQGGIYMNGVPRGIRTPVLGLKGRRPRPD